jgi:hypothetical protein
MIQLSMINLALVLALVATAAVFFAIGRRLRPADPTAVPEELLARLAQAESREAFQQRRADEFFAIISGIEREADEWRRIYRDSQRMGGAAQSWLLRDLQGALAAGNRYAARLRALGQAAPDLSVDPALADLVQEFGKTKDVPQSPRLTAEQAAPAEGPSPPAAVTE